MEFDVGALGFIGSLASVLVGILYCFFGYRVFKLVLGISGFLLGASIAGTIVYNTFDGNIPMVVVVGLVGGVVGAVVMVFLYFVGVFVLGAWAGGMLALALPLGEESPLRLFAVLALAIIGGVIALLLQKLMIILSTSLTGSWGIVSGALHFLGVGGGETGGGRLMLFPDSDMLRSVGMHGYGVLIAWLVVGVIGVAVQYSVTGRAKEKEEDED